MAFVIKEYLGYDLSKNISNGKEVKNMACKTRGPKKTSTKGSENLCILVILPLVS